MSRSSGKRITDPIYGSIELSEAEARLISTKSFQRLHNVKQLGLAHLVFPSASNSRFSHSVGAAVNARRLMESINSNLKREKFSENKIEIFRIVALFHDLGHYPFSHSTEHAINDYYSNTLLKPTSEEGGGQLFPTKASFDHEKLGEKILEHDPEINEILDDLGITIEEIKSTFADQSIKSIISSDLDCDRLDYLRRTAHHSGVPYGSVDVNFIISQATLDKDGKYCFKAKALRAVDHLLVGRFFDFSQIPYHKTVAALEWSLDAIISECLKRGLLAYSQDDVIGYIKNHKWHEHDESYFTTQFRVLRENLGPQYEIISDHLDSILFRKSAKQVFNTEKFQNNVSENNKSCLKECEEVRKKLVAKFSIDSKRLFIWHPKFKYAKSSPIARLPFRDLSEEEASELIHILPKKSSKKSQPLVNLKHSLAHQIAPIEYDTARVYYLPSKNDTPRLLNEMRAFSDNIKF